MRALSHFPNLTHLEIIDQGIDSIQGLEMCLMLEKLYLPDNNIREIQGLEQVGFQNSPNV